jgi:hypothetical protein
MVSAYGKLIIILLIRSSANLYLAVFDQMLNSSFGNVVHKGHIGFFDSDADHRHEYLLVCNLNRVSSNAPLCCIPERPHQHLKVRVTLVSRCAFLLLMSHIRRWLRGLKKVWIHFVFWWHQGMCSWILWTLSSWHKNGGLHTVVWWS